LKVLACGICGSDARVYFNGPPSRYLNPVILGHELSAEIAEVGPALEDYGVGDLVTVAPVIPCQHCPPCSRGEDNLCENGGIVGCTVHGGMAEYLTLPSQMARAGGVVRVPDGVGQRDAALAELVGCCLHGLGRLGLDAGDRVLVIGDGPIGLTFLQLARLMGATYVATSGRRPARRELADEFGADESLDAKVTNLADHFCGRSLDRVIVAASSVEATKDALKVVRPGGSVLLFAGYLSGSSLNVRLNEIHYGELSIHGSIDCTIQDFRRAVRLLPRLRMGELVTATFRLGEIEAAFRATQGRDAVKTILEFS
jgi:threonine dehydrogenase-like Zn-dependent dehydrogenase